MKDLKISKELLSEVLGIRTILMNPIIEPGNNIGYLVYGSQNTPEEVRRNHKQINIYEFAFQCKEWADDKYKANLISGKCKNFGYMCFTDNPYGLQYIKKIETQIANTEPEAIFKVCEYILKEINENR